jgi:hypothetical protein
MDRIARRSGESPKSLAALDETAGSSIVFNTPAHTCHREIDTAPGSIPITLDTTAARGDRS